MSSSKAVSQEEFSVTQGRVSFFVLFRPSTHWIRPTHMLGNLLYPVCLSICLSIYLFIHLFTYLFIFGCIGSSLLHAGFLQLWRVGATFCCGARASHCGGFSCCGSWTLEHRLSSCGAQAYLLCGMWDLPRPGLEPVSPALAGGFLTTAPPGKPQSVDLNVNLIQKHSHRKTRIMFDKISGYPVAQSS